MEHIIASGSDFLVGPLTYDVLQDQASYVTGRRNCQIFASVPEAGPLSVKSVKFNIADPNGFIDLSTLCRCRNALSGKSIFFLTPPAKWSSDISLSISSYSRTLGGGTLAATCGAFCAACIFLAKRPRCTRN